MNHAAAFAAVAAAAFAIATPAAAQPPVWVVTDKDSQLVLFGSVHVLPPGLDWRPPALANALRQADDLWFELPIDPATEAETARQVRTLGMLPAERTLSKMLAPDDAARLARVAQAYGLALPLLDRMQPWLAEVALAGALYRKAGAGTADGVEKAVAAAAPVGARRRAFETSADQIGFLAGSPPKDQIAALAETLREMEDKPDQFAVLLRAWMAGDLATLDREALGPLRQVSPALFRRMVTDRNARWATILDRRLKGRGRTVVVVGVGHLIGAGGLPARLRALGYSVKGP